MPGFRTHVGGGLLAYIACLVTLCSYFVFKPTLFKALEWFICTILGSLFPDVDTKSTGQMLFYRVTALLLLFLLWKQKIAVFIWVALLAMVPVLADHRGLFHKIWFVVFVPLCAALFLQKAYPVYKNALLFDAAFFSIGALSHILLDRGQTRLKKLRF